MLLPFTWLACYFLSCIDVVSASPEACTKTGSCERRKGDVLLMQLKPQLKRGIEETVPDPAALSLPACCLGCQNWCSPKSGKCHTLQEKSYYKPCARQTLQPGELLWADEFDGTSVNLSNWVHLTSTESISSGFLHYTDRLTNSLVENGVLKILANCEGPEELANYTSAKLSTQNLFDWGPGHRVEIRARVPQGRGLWPGVWMLPSKGGPWPLTGEIDIMEVNGCEVGKVSGAVHMVTVGEMGGALNQMNQTRRSNDYFAEYDKWHNYTIDWASDHINWYVDGQLFHHVQQEAGLWPFREKFFLNMNMAVGAPWASHCHDSKKLSCEDLGKAMEVDYVRVYQLKATSSS